MYRNIKAGEELISVGKIDKYFGIMEEYREEGIILIYCGSKTMCTIDGERTECLLCKFKDNDRNYDSQFIPIVNLDIHNNNKYVLKGF